MHTEIGFRMNHGHSSDFGEGEGGRGFGISCNNVEQNFKRVTK